MKKGEMKEKTGFTIIEVALVLAIAGLIFLMVFLALPALRATQRDTDRRENIVSFLENVKKFQNNNRGALPGGTLPTIISGNASWDNTTSGSTWEHFYHDYFDLDKFMDPVGERYQLSVFECGADEVGSKCTSDRVPDYDSVFFPNDYTMYVVIGASCDGSVAVATANPRKIAVMYRMERAGFYCSNS